MDEMIETVANKIPYGRYNAVSRKWLMQELGLSDRKVRKVIEKARQKGFMIVNLRNGNGYYQTSDLDEIAAQYWADTSYATSILSRRKHMREVLKAAGRAV